MNLHYREPDYDDTTCIHCGTKLPEQVKPGSWQDHGFCHMGCATKYRGNLDLHLPAALDLAQCPGPRGPGFESDWIRDWLRESTPAGPARLTRWKPVDDPSLFDKASIYSPDTVAWRLWANGGSIVLRLTDLNP